MSDNTNGDPNADISADESMDLQTDAVTPNWKVLGQHAAANGVGVLGQNDAGSGTPIGVKGAVPNSDAGYGLSTPDDAKVGGTAELNELGGGLTGNQTVIDLLGDGLTVASDALALGPTTVQTDTASSFGESDVSVVHSKTSVTDNAIELGPVASRPADNNRTSTDNRKYGLEFEPQIDLSEITATISSKTFSEGRAYLYNGTGNQLTSEPSPGSGNSVTLTTSLTAGTKYYVLIDDDGTNYYSGYYDNASFPYTYSMINITSGAYENSGSIATLPDPHAISKLEANEVVSGSATVAFSRPSSVRHWRTVSFQDEPDGETVEVYVETSSDGGSTWSDWQSKPIGPGTDLSTIPADDHVRFRVEFSRADTAKNPRLRLLSRQYSP